MFTITHNFNNTPNNGKGFRMTFDNGLSLSVQWGTMNYCDNNSMRRDVNDSSCANAEVAVWDQNGKWMTKVFIPGLMDDVAGYLTPNDVSDLMSKVANWRA